MTRKFLVKRNGYQFVESCVNHVPEDAILEYPQHIPEEDYEYVKVRKVVDDMGIESDEAYVDEDLKLAGDKVKEIEDQMDENDKYLAALAQLKNNKDIILDAITDKLDGDSSKFDSVINASKFVEFAYYKKEFDMGNDEYCAIVLVDGEFKIQKYKRGVKPSNFVRMAPTGFQPGDEEFLTHKEGGHFDVDVDGRLAKFKTLEKSAEDARQKDEWNEDNPFTRIKKSFIGG